MRVEDVNTPQAPPRKTLPGLFAHPGHTMAMKLAAFTVLFVLCVFIPQFTFMLVSSGLNLPYIYEVDFRFARAAHSELVFQPSLDASTSALMECMRIDADVFRCAIQSRLSDAYFINPALGYPAIENYRPVFLGVNRSSRGSLLELAEGLNAIAWGGVLYWLAQRIKGYALIDASKVRHPWAVATIGFLSMMMVAILISHFDTDTSSNFSFIDRNPAVTHVAATVFSIYIATPLLEEVIMRGVAWNALRQFVGPVAAALVISTGFAFLHGYPGVGTLMTFVVSLFLCAIRHYTGKLRFSVAAHAGMNLMVVLGALFDPA